MENVKHAMDNLDRSIKERGQPPPMPFEAFLEILLAHPQGVMRNVFQVFHDMIKNYVAEGRDEYPDDPESIHFVAYDCTRLFVEGSDHPFFADRLFANRIINLAESMKRGAQQNKIYIFDGPPGCGKSTFLNNLLMRFEEYCNTLEGTRYEAVWRIDRQALGPAGGPDTIPFFQQMFTLMERSSAENEPPGDEPANADAERHDHRHSPQQVAASILGNNEIIEIPCPSHDHPILMIPKHYRRPFFDDLFANDRFKWQLFTDKEYDWVFREVSCTICASIYQVLLNRLKSPLKVFNMLYARPYRFKRRLGQGISVFNPGDRPGKQQVLSNPMLQEQLNRVLKDSNQVKYIFSRYATTNNGIYALMDIKSHNIERLIELHNIISEGVHKVDDIEENVNSLLLALMNPEDKKNIQDFQSFSDRIEYIKIPYILDLNTEIAIYRNIFGRQIDDGFLPRVLHNFARVVISSRLNTRSEALLEWIGQSGKYRRFCDENLQLLKMEIYTGHIPDWLLEEDRKRFTAQRRRKIIGESEKEGNRGLSGRDSIKIFNQFYSSFARQDKLITMADLCKFFEKIRKDLLDLIPTGFLDSLLRNYNYTVLQEVKESLFYYNREQINRDLLNYLFAINFEIGSVETSTHTGDRLEISEAFLTDLENRILGNGIAESDRHTFRADTQKEYTTRTLTQEIMIEGIPIIETKLFQGIHERYAFNLKAKALDPFLDNENFRQGIKDYNTPGFRTYDKKIREDVTFLIGNLGTKYHYTEKGAQEVCIYVIDNDLARKFGQTE
ncbi:MAG: serine protein kinase PrkA [Desulfobacterales bacterium]|nr:serine protein kinase PrkA [Desulfobacterales bacterium]